jgi:exodeoxyribonuclease VII small subunit
MTAPDSAPDSWRDELAGMTFEESYRRLEQTVGRLEEGELSLTDAERLYTQGMELAQRCQKLLTETELRITQLGQTGEPRLSAIDPPDDDWTIPPAPEPDDPALFDDDPPF